MKKFVLSVVTVAILSGCTQASSDNIANNSLELLAQGKYQDAVVSLRDGLQTHKNNAELLSLLVRTYNQMGAYEFSSKEANKLIELQLLTNNNLADIAEALALSESEVGLGNLWKDTQQNSALDAKLVVPFYLISSDLQSEQQLEILKDYSPADSKTISWLDMTAKGQWNDFSKLMVKEPVTQQNYFFHHHALQYLLQIANYNDAATISVAMNDIRPNDFRTLVFATISTSKGDNIPKAIELAKKLAKLEPENPVPAIVFATEALTNANYAEAKKQVDFAISKRLDNFDVRLVGGVANYVLGDYEQAYNHFEKIEDKLPPTHAVNQFILSTKVALGYDTEALDFSNQIELSNANAASLMQLTGNFFEKGNTETASALLDKLNALEPSDPNQQFNLELVQAQLSNNADTEKLLSAFETSDKSFKKKALILNTLISSEQGEVATNLVNSWIEESPDSVAMLSLKASLLTKLLKEEQLPEVMQQIKNIQPTNALANTYFAYRTLQDGDANSAISQFLAVQESNFYDRSAFLGYLKAARMARKLDAVSSQLKLLAEKHKDKLAPATLVDFAYAATTANNTDMALNFLEQVPENSKARNKLFYRLYTNVMLASGDVNKANLVLDEWQRQSPNESMVYLSRAFVQETQGNVAGALRVAQDAKRRFGANSVFTIMEIEYQRLLGRVSDARNAWKSTDKSAIPTFIQDRIEGGLLAAEGKLSQAAKKLETSYSVEGTASTAVELINTYGKLKDKAALKRFAEQHLTTTPSDMKVRTAYAEWLMRNGANEALNQYQVLLNQGDQRPAILNNYAWLSLQAGHLEAALKAAEKANDIAPSSASILDTLAAIKTQQGQTKEAIALLADAYSANPKRFDIAMAYVKHLIVAKEVDQAKYIMAQFTPNTENEKAIYNRLKASI